MKEYHIVGGGTSSWMLAQALLKYTKDKVTLINSTKIEKIGVGESSIPMMINYLDWCGLNTAEFIKATGASIKLGIMYSRWKQDDVDFGHLFGGKWYDLNVLKLQKLKYDDLNRYLTDNYFHIENNTIANDLLSSSKGYGLHFSSEKVIDYYRENCEVYDRFTFIKDHITDIKFDDEGHIESIKGDDREYRVGFLFDNTGFNGLINDNVDSNWYDASHILFNNKVIVIRRPYREKENPNNYTENKRMDYGWQWHIALRDDVSFGYVFSGDYIDFDQAEQELRTEIDEFTEPVKRRISFNGGYHETLLNKNYCLMGLSAGFFEPLEATHIGTTQRQIIEITNLIQTGKLELPNYQKLYNTQMINWNKQVMHFISMVYQLCEFNHTEYWQDIHRRRCDSLDRLLENLEDFIPGFDLMFGKFDVVQMLNGYNYCMSLPTVNISNMYKTEFIPSKAQEFYKNDQKKSHRDFLDDLNVDNEWQYTEYGKQFPDSLKSTLGVYGGPKK